MRFEEFAIGMFGTISTGLLGFIAVQVWNMSKLIAKMSVQVEDHAGDIRDHGARITRLETARMSQNQH